MKVGMNVMLTVKKKVLNKSAFSQIRSGINVYCTQVKHCDTAQIGHTHNI